MAIVDIDSAPRKARDLYQKGFAALERNNLDYSMDMFSAALEIEPRLLQARKFLRAAGIKQFKSKKGGSLTHGLSSLKGMGSVMGVNSAIKKNPQQAVVLAEKLLRTDALNKGFIKVFCDAAIAADLTEAAVQTLEIAREHYPQDVEILSRLAKLYMDMNLTREGKQCYELLVQLRPNDQKALKYLKDAAAIDTMNKGGWNEASSYRDVIKDTKAATRLEQQGKTVKTSRDIDDLIEETRSKIEQEPANINYRRGLADLLVKAERYDDALGVLHEALKTAGAGDPQIDRSISDITVKKFDKQIQGLTTSGDTAGADAVEAERDAFLLEAAEDRVQRYPNDLQFKFEYGELLFSKGGTNDAIQQFQQSQRNPQKRITSLYYLGLCFKEKKQYDIAAEQLEKAKSELHSMDNEKKKVVYELGQLFEVMSEPEKALQQFKEIYAVDIGFRDIAEKIEQGYH